MPDIAVRGRYGGDSDALFKRSRRSGCPIRSSSNIPALELRISDSSRVVLRTLVERYAPLTESEWSEFNALLRARTLERDAHFVSVGRVPTQLGFIVCGSMRRYVIDDGAEIVFSFLRAGSLVSDYSALVLNAPATQSLQALERTQLLTIGIDDLARLGAKHNAWRQFSVNAGAHAVRRAEQRMTSRSAESPLDRLEALIASWPDVFATVRKHHVASYIGVTPEHLSRLLAQRRNVARAS